MMELKKGMWDIMSGTEAAPGKDAKQNKVLECFNYMLRDKALATIVLLVDLLGIPTIQLLFGEN